MASQTIYVLGGVAITGIGIGYLLSPELARKFVYRHASGSWPPSKSKNFEKISVLMIRFFLGPLLIAVGSMLVAKGLQNST
jgi:hypothetical protein